MNEKPKIKLLKRGERTRIAKSAAAAAAKKSTVDPTRKIVQTVSGWVRDFKDKSGQNSLVAAMLLKKATRPNEI